jgi:hypothetical protein
MKHPLLAGAILLACFSSAFAARLTPLAPRGGGTASQGGGRQDRKVYLTGSTSGALRFFFNMNNVADRVNILNGRDVIFELDFTTGIGSRDVVFEGSAKTINVLFNPGGNPNPTTQWSYLVDFNFPQGSNDFVAVDNTFTELDDRVLPGVNQVNLTRNGSNTLGKSVSNFLRRFPPGVRLVRNRLDPNQGLVLPRVKIDVGDLRTRMGQVSGADAQADQAFNGLSGLNFVGIDEQLQPVRDAVADLPNGVQPGNDVVQFLSTHNLDVEMQFIPIDDALAEKDFYDERRAAARVGFFGQLRKLSLYRRATVITNNVMRGESGRVRTNQQDVINRLANQERGIVEVSHQGILFRIR